MRQDLHCCWHAKSNSQQPCIPWPSTQAITAPLAALRAQLSGAHLSGSLGDAAGSIPDSTQHVGVSMDLDVTCPSAQLQKANCSDGLRLHSSSSLQLEDAAGVSHLLGVLANHGLIGPSTSLPVGATIEVRILSRTDATPASREAGACEELPCTSSSHGAAAGVCHTGQAPLDGPGSDHSTAAEQQSINGLLTLASMSNEQDVVPNFGPGTSNEALVPTSA